jgi:hypothetical protein
MVGVVSDKLFVFRPQLSTVSLSSSVKGPLESANQFYELRTFSLIDGRELFQRIVSSPLLSDFSTSGRKKPINILFVYVNLFLILEYSNSST